MREMGFTLLTLLQPSNICVQSSLIEMGNEKKGFKRKREKGKKICLGKVKYIKAICLIPQLIPEAPPLTKLMIHPA